MNPLQTTILSKKTLGTFAIAAVMSVLFIKMFSELALADEIAVIPVLHPPQINQGQVLGIYQVSTITGHDGKIINCPAPDSRCKLSVMPVRDGNQIALLSAKRAGAESWVKAVLSTGDCLQAVSPAAARDHLFKSGICKARLSDDNNPDTDDASEVFMFKEPRAGRSVEKGINALFMIFTGSSAFERHAIYLPKGESIPQSFESRKLILGSAVYMPVSVADVVKFERVSD